MGRRLRRIGAGGGSCADRECELHSDSSSHGEPDALRQCHGRANDHLDASPHSFADLEPHHLRDGDGIRQRDRQPNRIADHHSVGDGLSDRQRHRQPDADSNRVGHRFTNRDCLGEPDADRDGHRNRDPCAIAERNIDTEPEPAL